VPTTSPGVFGSPSTFVIFIEGSAFLTNTVSTPSSMPSDHAVTSYGGSGGAFGPRRTSGYVCFSSMSLSYRANTCVIGMTNVPAAYGLPSASNGASAR